MQQKSVHDADSEHQSPQNRMRTNERSVWKCHGADDEEQTSDRLETEVDVIFRCRCISKLKFVFARPPNHVLLHKRMGHLRRKCFVEEVCAEERKHRERVRFVEDIERDVVHYPFVDMTEAKLLELG